MKSLYRKYFVSKVLTRTTVMVTVLTSVMMAIQSTEAIEQLEGVSLSFFIYYLCLSLPSVLVVVLAMVFPIGMYWTINYLRDDGEILAMQTVGTTKRSIRKWVLECGLLGSLIVWLLVSVIEPYCLEQMSFAVATYSKNHFFSMLKPKSFNVQSGSVIYAEEVDANKHALKNVFILQSQPQVWSMLNSEKLVEQSDGSVVFEEGETVRYTIKDQVLESSEVSTFDSLHGDPFHLFNLKTESNKSTHQSLNSLWENKHNGSALARLCWVISLPMVTLLLTLSAASNMFTPPRASMRGQLLRFTAGLIACILVVILFQRQADNNFLSHMPLIGLILPPIIMALVLILIEQTKKIFR